MKFKCINCKGLGHTMQSYIDTINGIYKLIPINCSRCDGTGYIGFWKWVKGLIKGLIKGR